MRVPTELSSKASREQIETAEISIGVSNNNLKVKGERTPRKLPINDYDDGRPKKLDFEALKKMLYG